MEKTLTTNYKLTDEEIKKHKEKIKQEIPDAVLDLTGNNSIKRIDSFMDYFMNEIVLSEIDKYIELENLECKQKFRFDSMSFNIYDSHEENSIEFGIIYTDNICGNFVSGFLNNIKLKVVYNDEKDEEEVEDVLVETEHGTISGDELLIPFNGIADILITLIKGFDKEILYVVKAMREYINKIKSISYSIINATSKDRSIRLNANANGSKVTLRLKNQSNNIFIDMQIFNYDSINDGLSIMSSEDSEDEYINIGKSIMYAIRNMNDNILF